jgi:hypothetical protein
MIESTTKEHPKNFKTWEVLAIQEDRKIQFREVIKPQPEYNPYADMFTYYSKVIDTNFACQSGDRTSIFGKYVIGDRLWVRETFQYCFDDPGNIAYKADFVAIGKDKLAEKIIWKPSIFMPRSACRILLEITDVRIELLQDISEKDAIAEGIKKDDVYFSGKNHYVQQVGDFPDPCDMFRYLWDSINAKTQPWKSNPWVWVVEFKRITA